MVVGGKGITLVGADSISYAHITMSTLSIFTTWKDLADSLSLRQKKRVGMLAIKRH